MELRECPFCGGDFVIEVVCRDWDDYMIDCGCGCSFHFPHTRRDELIMQWNRRVSDRYTVTPAGRAMLKDGGE